MTEIEKLKIRLDQLEANSPTTGWTFFETGEWFVKMARLQLEIAKLLLGK